jgi:hypothetical protein
MKTIHPDLEMAADAVYSRVYPAVTDDERKEFAIDPATIALLVTVVVAVIKKCRENRSAVDLVNAAARGRSFLGLIPYRRVRAVVAETIRGEEKRFPLSMAARVFRKRVDELTDAVLVSAVEGDIFEVEAVRVAALKYEGDAP